MSKEEIRQRAAIAVLPECVRTCNEVLSRGGKLTEETQAKQAAMMAVAYADELAEKLSNVSENGKNCNPANFAKSSKDLQESKQDEDTKVYYPTPFDQKLYALASSCCMLSDDSRKIFILEHSKDLLDIAYKQFERSQLNPKLEEYEQLFQRFNVAFMRFNEAVNEEIKRRCDAIDAKEMGKEYFRTLPGSDYYAPERLHNRTVEHREAYKQGVIDTIKKLKGE